MTKYVYTLLLTIYRMGNAKTEDKKAKKKSWIGMFKHINHNRFKAIRQHFKAKGIYPYSEQDLFNERTSLSANTRKGTDQVGHPA